MFRFYLRNPKETTDWTEIQEPDGWDGVEFFMERSDQYAGLENSYSDNITFTGDGAEFLMDVFENYLFDNIIDFKYELYCNGSLSSTFIGAINMITYSEVNGEVSVKVEDSTFDRKIKNRIDNIVNLDKTTSIEGVALTDVSTFDLPLHSKQIELDADLLFEDTSFGVIPEGFEVIGFDVDTVTVVYNISESERTLQHSISQDLLPKGESEIKDTSEDLSTITRSDTYPSNNQQSQSTALFELKGYEGEMSIDIALGVGSLFSLTVISNNSLLISPTWYWEIDFALFMQVNSDAPVLLDSLITSYQNGTFSVADINTEQSLGLLSASLNYTGTVELQIDDSVKFYIKQTREIRLERPNNPGADYVTSLTQYNIMLADGSYMNFQINSLAPASISKSWYIYEALNRVVESITDTTDAVKSDFFGRIDNGYSYNGCGSYLALTNGLNIRGMKDKDMNFYPVTTSLRELIESLDCVYSIGMRVENDGTRDYLRVEPKEYFYDTNSFFTIQNVADIKRSIAVEYIYNQFEVGYQEWEIEDVNGIDEINTKHNYTIPITTGKAQLSRISRILAGAYAIEWTRRIQFSTNSTTDSKYDNNNFFIALSRIEQTFETQEEDPYFIDGDTYPKIYEPYELPERDESFTVVNDYISPETAYNLRLSPVRMAMNWHPVLLGSITQDATKKIVFISGEGNTIESDELVDACEPTLIVYQNQDLEASDFESYKGYAFFKPVYAEFEYPGSIDDYILIKQNSNKSINYSCGSSIFTKGYIKSISFKPISEDGGMLQFKILESLYASCVDGAFDEGFDDGFDIGVC